MSNPSKQKPNCTRCDLPIPKGRRRYCSDECYALTLAARTRARDDLRIAACQRCQGPKEPGVRGGRYCNACRLIIADTTAQMEFERSRRKSLAANAIKLASENGLRRRIIDTPDGMKWCARCQDFRPLESFPPRKETGKQAAYCIPCQRSYNRERRLLLTYGLTYEDYEFLFACQDGRCAICDGRPRKHMLSVDHDHKTGEIRGLLCSRCNHKLLGSANDDPARLRKAADYLEAFGPREVFGEPRFMPGSTAEEQGRTA